MDDAEQWAGVMGTRLASQADGVRRVRNGEHLAIYDRAIHADPLSMFWFFGPEIRPNEYREDGIGVVHINGPLEQHDEGHGDNYESIRARVEEALAHEKARVVVMRIDSPGGVVAGLNQCVAAIRRAKIRANSGQGKRLIAYVDELTASAAYAISCSADEIAIPPSGIAGSIGTISTMLDVVGADRKAGYNFRTIASGARKADGHVHVPISDDAVEIEQRRVDKLANQFFRLASRARTGLSVPKIKSYEAAIFLGKEAKAAGLADSVMGWDDLVLALSQVDTPNGSGSSDVSEPKNGAIERKKGNITKREVAAPAPKPTSTGQSTEQSTEENQMALALAALIKKTEEAIATEKDPKKLAKLALDLAAYKKTEKRIEKTEEGDDDDDSDDDDDEEGSEAAADDDDDSDDDSDDDDEESDDEEDEEDDEEDDEEAAAKSGKTAKAVLALVERATGKKGRAAKGALEALIVKARQADALTTRVESIEADARRAKKTALVDEALAQRRITKHMAKDLRGKSLRDVESFLSLMKKPLVHTSEEALSQPDGRGGGDVPESVRAQFEAAAASSGGKVTVEQLTANYRAELAKRQGANSRI